MMYGVIAMDSFKGSLSSVQAAEAVKRGLVKGGIANVAIVPVADGGEGLTDALLYALGGKRVISHTNDANFRPVDSEWALLDGGSTAVIEMASCCGLTMIAEEDRNIRQATTCGVGKMIRDALKQGVKKIILGLGGSATNDMGAGMAQALGYVFRDAHGSKIPPGAVNLASAFYIDDSNVSPRLRDVEFIAACDVTNPLCGENGASRVFAPQKGANWWDVELLEQALFYFATLVERKTGVKLLDLPGGGAAGGMGAGAKAFLNAQLVPGFDIVAKETRLAEKIANSDFVITGEGKTDAQSVMGKVPYGVGMIAKEYNKPVIVLSGALEKGYEKLYDCGITSCFSASEGAMRLEDCMNRAAELLENQACSIGRLMEKLVR